MLHEVVLEVFEDPEDEGLDLVIKDPAAGPDRRVDEVVEVVFLVGDINDLRKSTTYFQDMKGEVWSFRYENTEERSRTSPGRRALSLTLTGFEAPKHLRAKDLIEALQNASAFLIAGVSSHQKRRFIEDMDRIEARGDFVELKIDVPDTDEPQSP